MVICKKGYIEQKSQSKMYAYLIIPFIRYSRTDRTNLYRLIRKWLPGAGNGVDWLQRGTGKLLAMMQMFCILNKIMIIGLLVKSHHQLHMTCPSVVLCIIYASVMFILKIKKLLKWYVLWVCVEFRKLEIFGGFEWHQRKVWNFCVCWTSARSKEKRCF